MKLVKLMDSEKVKLLLQTGQVLNETRRRYAEAMQTGDERAIELTRRNMERWQDRWTELRRGTTLFLVASTLINADVLGEEFFSEELEAGLEGIDTNLLSIPQKLTADQKFYVTLNAGHFYQDGNRIDVLERHDYGWEQDCSVLKYLDPGRPLDGGMDDGNMKSMVFGQQRGREYRVLKELFTLPPDNERQLADKFIAYFKPHKTKLLRLYYDRAMNNYKKIGTSAIQRIKQAIETNADGSRSGWRVQLMSLGQGTIYSNTEYQFFSALFAGNLKNRLFILLIDAQNCPNLKAEMENAPIKVVEVVNDSTLLVEELTSLIV